MILVIGIALAVVFWALSSFVLYALFDTHETCRRIEAKLDSATKHFEVKQ